MLSILLVDLYITIDILCACAVKFAPPARSRDHAIARARARTHNYKYVTASIRTYVRTHIKSSHAAMQYSSIVGSRAVVMRY